MEPELPVADPIVVQPEVVEPEVFAFASPPSMQPQSPQFLPPEPEVFEPKREFQEFQEYQDDVSIMQRLGPERYVEERPGLQVEVGSDVGSMPSRTISFPDEEDTDEDLMPALEDRMPPLEERMPPPQTPTPPRIVRIIKEPYDFSEDDFSGKSSYLKRI